MQAAVVRQAIPFQPNGFRIAYHRGITNHCPGCTQTQWIIGRITAQCAFCATAVPLAVPMPQLA